MYLLSPGHENPGGIEEMDDAAKDAVIVGIIRAKQKVFAYPR